MFIEILIGLNMLISSYTLYVVKQKKETEKFIEDNCNNENSIQYNTPLPSPLPPLSPLPSPLQNLNKFNMKNYVKLK
jgi:hypothetical protein